MSIRCGIIMDPLDQLHTEKDSTLAIIEAAQARGWEVFYLTEANLSLRQGKPFATVQKLTIDLSQTHWHQLSERKTVALSDLDVLMMRKDPPVDDQYLYTTHLLDRAGDNTLVVNRPQALRDINEKLFISWFAKLCPETLVSPNKEQLKDFIHNHEKTVLKPLHGMGGESIFCLNKNDINMNVTIEQITDHGKRFAMAQRFIPEVTEGDKRILLIDGNPVDAVLARIPAGDDIRGNLAAGASSEVRPLTERDREICRQVGPVLKEKGVIFAGLDVIGDYLTEINVTSPTCIRELAKGGITNIAEQLIVAIENQLH